MALNETNVCNMALVELGADTITSFTDGTVNATRCGTLYAPTRDATLEAHDWSFARKRAALTKLAETPEFEFDNVFMLPNDCIRPLHTDIETDGWPWRVPPSVQTVWVDDRVKQWQVEGRKLYTNASTVDLLYTARITAPDDWTKLFLEAMTLHLCARLAWPVTRSRGVRLDYEKMYLAKLESAASVDAQVGDDEGWVRDDITRERF